MAFQTQSFNKYNPETTQILQQLLQQGSQGLQGFKPTSFEPYAQKAREGFASQTVPLLAERFGALGGESRGSSGLTGQLSSAGGELESMLGMLGAQHDAGQQQQAMSLYQLLTQLGLGSNENVLQEEEPGWGKTLLQGGINAAPEILSLLGAGIGSIVPGLGTAAGGALGGTIGAGIKGGFGTSGQQQPKMGQNQQQQIPLNQLLSVLSQQNQGGMGRPQGQQQAYNPGQYNPDIMGSYFSQLNKYNQNPMPRFA